MKNIALSLTLISSLFIVSCGSDDDSTTPSDSTDVVAPATYSFTRDGNSSVSYSGQSTRIAMAEELIAAMKDNTRSVDQLNGMFAHVEGENDFNDATLNASGKSVRSKVAASKDFFSGNSTDAAALKSQFDGWINNQTTEVFTNWDNIASAGIAGQLQEAGGGSIRYMNTQGLEYNQAVAKSLLGALMVDQMLNNYLGTAVLDEADNRDNNDNGVLAEGKGYTTMEHKWDEAFGYLYGAELDATSPVLNVDSFLSKYLSRVEGDADFTGIATKVYNGFKLGRAAIVAKNYTVRDEQAQIIREEISKVVGVRAVYYLQQAKATLGTDNAAAFHDLSEGFGFVFSLQFTRQPDSTNSYFTKIEVDNFMNQLMAGNGFWDLTPETLDTISNEIAARFDFTVAQAAN